MEPTLLVAGVAAAAVAGAGALWGRNALGRRATTRLKNETERASGLLRAVEGQLSDFTLNDRYVPEKTRRVLDASLRDVERTSNKMGRLARWAAEPERSAFTSLQTRVSETRATLANHNGAYAGRRIAEHQKLLVHELGLDQEQQLAVVRDDERNLVVAGAGSGKTRTLTARIMYLVERGVPPERIVAVTFTRKARAEMESRLRARNVPVAERKDDGVRVFTLHALGKRAVDAANGSPVSVADEGWTNAFLAESLRAARTAAGQELADLYLNALIHFHRNEDERAPLDAEDKSYRTLRGDHVRSLAERVIADFLYTNRVAYKYEKRADWAEVGEGYGAYHPDFTLLDANACIEHWGVDRQGGTRPGVDPARYAQKMQWAREECARNRITLIETWDYERSEGTLRNHLRSRLVAAGIRLQPMTLDELEAANKEMKYIGSIIEKLLGNFVSNARSLRRRPDEIRADLSKYPPRVEHFGRLGAAIVERYERLLEAEGRVDFADMLHRAADAIEGGADVLPRYEHVLVDEFQDTSPALAGFIQALVAKDPSRLFVVGDDWQAIYGWAGGDVDYLVNFEKHFGPATQTLIRTNYRSPSLVVEAGAALIAKNENQIHKEVLIHSKVRGEAWVHDAPDDDAAIVDQTVSLVQAELKEREPKDILVISRANHTLRDVATACRSLGIRVDMDDAESNGVRLLSAHRAKGLEAPCVIIVNASDHRYGFPSQVEDPDVLDPVRLTIGNSDEEERRLFYVALTRAEERLHLVVRHGLPSPYIAEIEGTTHATENDPDPVELPEGQRFDGTFAVERLYPLSDKQQAIGIRQSGLLATPTARVGFTSWSNTRMQTGATYRIDGAQKDKPFRDTPKIKLDDRTSITLITTRPAGKRNHARPLQPSPPPTHRPQLLESRS